MATGKKILYILLLGMAVSALPAQDLESLKSAKPVSITGNIGLNSSFTICRIPQSRRGKRRSLTV